MFKKKSLTQKLGSLQGFYRKRKDRLNLTLALLVIFVLAVFSYNLFSSPAKDFPVNSVFKVESGDTLSDVAEKLEDGGFIKSSFWLKNVVIVLQGERGIRAGDYYFNEPENLVTVAKRISSGDYGLEPVRVTIPEGLNIFEISEALEERFVDFEREEFLELAQEGFLFPDTYFFLPNVRAPEIVAVMKSNFHNRVEELIDEIEDSDKTLEEIINMASIIETEARDSEARKKISGILWRRIDIGMPLQVDVTFKYINGKNTYELTRDDLRIDSPYNTYVYTGLPPTPIANPGIDSILAALHPTESEYLYFLSDRSGNMYYSEDFDGHVENRQFMDN